MVPEPRSPPYSALIMWTSCGEPHCTETKEGRVCSVCVLVCVVKQSETVNGKECCNDSFTSVQQMQTGYLVPYAPQ